MTQSPMLLHRLAAGAAAAAFVALLAATPLTAQAAPKMMSHGKMSHKMMAKTVYACTECKMYYTPTQAKSMKYTDPMGHKLTKMAKAPAGFMPGGKMGGKMMDKDKMGGTDKM